MTKHIKQIAQELSQQADKVQAAVELIDAGNTIPFIARYRKEATGSMDDQILRQLAERLEYLRGLDERKETVKASIEEQGAWTEALSAALEKAQTLAEVEDIYRPYKPKRKTRASIAKAKGLQPLADWLLRQEPQADPFAKAVEFLTEEVVTVEDALAGARDIIAEIASDTAALRAKLRSFYFNSGMVVTKAAKDEDSVYSSYYEFSQSVSKIAGHRVLAIDRGERENFLKVSIQVNEETALNLCLSPFIRNQSACAKQIELAIEDSYSRLIHPSLEREVRSTLTEQAAEGAIEVFGQNLRQLLLAPPIKGKVAMGLDPGYRMGCKVAVVDATGKVLDTAVVYPVPEFKKVDAAKKTIHNLIEKHNVEIIAIGNGTAGKETEIFAAEVIQELSRPVSYMVVSEAGASVYSAGKLAAEEFPEYDVNLRSAVSIARRLQDPLAELVKIDPKAVGVGQYQHDMPPARLAATLDGVVEDCVNTVGVDLNTASAPLLERVAGVTKTTAKNIVKYREESGAFASRKQLLKVKGLGPKAFEQCAGFLRLPHAADPLDSTAVHPESYTAAHALLEICGYQPQDIGSEHIKELPQTIKTMGEKQIADKLNIGIPTLQDIVAELLRPGRDMRDELPAPMLRTDVMKLEDLKPGMKLKGTVRNVIDFGAFVDIGVHQDGLVHISQICNRFIRHPSEVLKVGDVVTVWVMQVDIPKKRIALTMKQQENMKQ